MTTCDDEFELWQTVVAVIVGWETNCLAKFVWGLHLVVMSDQDALALLGARALDVAQSSTAPSFQNLSNA